MVYVEKIISFDFDQNCYLVYDDNKNGFLIDPGFDTLKILKRIDELGVNVGYIPVSYTHLHIKGTDMHRYSFSYLQADFRHY